MDDTLNSLREQLKQLEDLHAAGTLTGTAYDEARLALERRILAAVLNPTSPPPGGGSVVPAPSSAKTHGGAWGLWATLLVTVAAVAAAGYWWQMGRVTKTSSVPQLQGMGTAPRAASAPGPGNAPHDTSSGQIEAMTDRLAAKLKDNPDNAEGWAMLARSYGVLGRHPEALGAYERALALRKDDPTLIADYADSLAIKNKNSLLGEPMKLVERALKLDPRNPKALSLAGTAAFDRKDYAGAVKYWEQVVQFAPPNDVIVQQVQSGIAQARALGGLPAAAPTVASATSAPVVSGSSLSGTVTLSAALSRQVAPEDTVFIFARPAQGGRMPLAVLRRQVKDLPIQFRLDDSMALSPQTKLSDATQVVVGARVSKSGNAVPQSGDFTGEAAPVKPGATAIAIEIRDRVQ